MAKNEMVGNMNTEWMINYFNENGLRLGINNEAMLNSLKLAEEVFAV